MKYIIGSFIISFGVLAVGLCVLIAMEVNAPDNVLAYLGLAWGLLAIVSYPLARKLVR